MYNGNAGNGYGNSYSPHVEVTMPPEEQDIDDDGTYTGGLASQDINAQHYVPNSQNLPDGGLTYGEGRTYQHSDSFADHAPHTLPHPASEAAAAVVVASGAKTTVTVPRAAVDDDLTDGADTYVDSWTDEPVSPMTRVTTVHGQAPPPPLARQQTFGRVSGPHHVSAMEAFPAAAGVADRSAGPDGAAALKAQPGYGSTPVPSPAFSPMNMAGPGKRRLPWAGQFFRNTNWFMTGMVLAWLAVTIGYVCVRAIDSLTFKKGVEQNPKGLLAYGIWVLIVEVLGASTLLLYAVHLMVHVRKFDPPFVRKPFSVRVVVPCYKEDIETLEETVECAIKAAKIAMDKGQANAVHIYLCDDAPADHKEDYQGESYLAVTLRQELIDQLYKIHGIPVIRVRRDKGKGEANPKSANLNSCLRKIYGDDVAPPEMEVVAVFDADQAAHSHFFTSTLPWMDAGDDVAVVQSPQVFRGVHWSDDVFNHENVGFWHYLQPAYNVMGFISCAGTNFVIRSSAFAEAGYFPTHTLTEDYALGMEMRRKGWRGMYVEDELVRGSAPDKVRAAFGQRSRWCKGPYQMLFSRKSPLFAPGLSIFFRILYMSPCYIYIVSALASPTFMVIPVVFIWVGAFPAVLTKAVLVMLIAYTVLSSFIKFYVRPGRNIVHDLRSHWNAEVSTKNFWWMYAKASVRGTMAAWGCGALGWTPGAGGGKKGGCWFKVRQASQDLLFILIFAIILTVTIVYGFLMVAAGGKFVGPLGLSLMWCIYHALAPWLLLFYSILPFEFEVKEKKWWYATGRTLFNILCNVGFVMSFGVFIAAVVLAFVAGEDSFKPQNLKNSNLHLSPRQVFSNL